jgi:hypothetical protein
MPVSLPLRGNPGKRPDPNREAPGDRQGLPPGFLSPHSKKDFPQGGRAVSPCSYVIFANFLTIFFGT